MVVETERYFTWNQRVRLPYPLRRLADHLLLMATVESERYFEWPPWVRIPAVDQLVHRNVRGRDSPAVGPASIVFWSSFPIDGVVVELERCFASGAGSPGSNPGGGNSAVV